MRLFDERKLTPGRALLWLAATHAVILIIGIVSLYFYLTIFPASFRGWPEITPYQTIAGWVVNEAVPQASVEVELYIDNHFVAAKLADISRPDVVAAGRATNDKCGFNFPLPTLERGEHVAQVYAAHKIGVGVYRSLQRIGKPLRFKTP